MEMTMEDMMAEEIRQHDAAERAGLFDCPPSSMADFDRWRRRHEAMVMTNVIAIAFGLDAGDRERLRARLDNIDVYSDEEVRWVLMNRMRSRTMVVSRLSPERIDADSLDGHEGEPMASLAVAADDGDTGDEPASTGAHALRGPAVPVYERLI